MHRRGALALVLATLTVLAGCQLGERPSFSTDPFVPGAMTGDAAVDAVLAKFDAATTGPVTAAYTILRKFDPQDFSAIVVLAGERRSITVGNVRYIQTAEFSSTCTVDGSSPCQDGLVSQAISNTNVTVDFYAAEAAKRLRRDAQAMTGPGLLHNETIVQQAATCVDVTLAEGTATYCAMDNGLVALLDDGDVMISLSLFADTVDETAFATNG